jgi:hemolysin D
MKSANPQPPSADPQASNKVVALPRAAARRRDFELAFLPAALEVMETPPSPIGRAITFTIVALFAIAILWASLGHVDQVAVAQGKIVQSGRSKVIQPLEIGVVRAIHVEDGQRVKEGELLVELDSTASTAERDHLRSDLLSSELEIARLEAALAGSDNPLADFKPPPGASKDMVDMQSSYLVSQVAEHRSKMAELAQRQAEKEGDRAVTAATIDKINAVKAPLEERVNMRKYLFDNALGSRLTYLTEYQDLVDKTQELTVQQKKLTQTDAAISGIEQARLQAEAEFRRTLYTDLAKAEEKAGGLRQDVIKAEEKTKRQQLTSPVDGVVQQLAVHTIGGVVTPAQPLLVVVPGEAALEVEAMVSNRDIGFVSEGQEAQIKVDTFNFTRYGLIHGNVLSVARDSVARGTAENKPGDKPSTGDAAANDKGQDLVYQARVSLDRTAMQVDDKVMELTPGMGVTVEVKTGSRRIISYLLSPLTRYGHDALRER